MKYAIPFLLCISFGCATQAPEHSFKKESNKTLWLGKTEEKLALHPVFATYPVETRKTPQGVETRRYTEGGIVTSNGECTGSNCAGISDSSACNHVFYLKGGVITNYHPVGRNCVERFELRPVDEDGKPELTQNEIKQLRTIAKENDESLTECKTRKDCKEAMTCKKSYESATGICVNHGIFGKLFND